MRELVRYLCSSCGGALIVDRNQDVFDCPFCGNAYKSDDMHRDERLADAEKNLKQREFHSAKDKYDSILAGDPEDFEALRGLVLCAGKIPGLASLHKPEKLNEENSNGFAKALDDVKKRAGEEDIPYFNKMSELLEIAKERQKFVADLGKLEKESEEEKQEHKNSNDKFGCLYIIMFIASIIALYIWFLSNPDSFVRNAIFIFPAEIAFFAAVVFIPDKLENKRHDKTEHAIELRKRDVKEKIAGVDERYSRAYDEMNQLASSDKKIPAPVYTPLEDSAEE